MWQSDNCLFVSYLAIEERHVSVPVVFHIIPSIGFLGWLNIPIRITNFINWKVTYPHWFTPIWLHYWYYHFGDVKAIASPSRCSRLQRSLQAIDRFAWLFSSIWGVEEPSNRFLIRPASNSNSESFTGIQSPFQSINWNTSWLAPDYLTASSSSQLLSDSSSHFRCELEDNNLSSLNLECRL
jgi:hypothetical protein